MHTPDPSPSGLGTETGAGLGVGAGVGVGAEAGIGSGQPSVSIEYAGQARLRRSLHCKLCSTHTHPSPTHTLTQRSRSTQFGRSPVEGSQPTSRCSGARAQRFKFSSLNNILFCRAGSGGGDRSLLLLLLPVPLPQLTHTHTQLCPVASGRLSKCCRCPVERVGQGYRATGLLQLVVECACFRGRCSEGGGRVLVPGLLLGHANMAM